ncbi:MAG: hypothetical protein ACKVUT_03625 [Gaiella sp.]
MSSYHVVATLAGGNTKTVTNRSEADILTDFVLPFISNGTITTKWGKETKTRQALEMRVYCTKSPHYKKGGQTFEELIKGKQNRYKSFEKRANAVLSKKRTRVFVITPIQGEKYGPQEQQRIFKEYDERFAAIEQVLDELSCVAIRIDKEAPLEGLVDRIKSEIQRAQFVIADLTDERPSCYYELGYADGIEVPAICVASKDSVLHPGTATKIHFDIHRAVQFFTNHEELKAKIQAAYSKNEGKLLADRNPSTNIELAV